MQIGQNQRKMTHQKYASVVIHVKETQLLKSLLRQDKESIEEIQYLGDIKYIQDECNRWLCTVEFIAW